MQHRQIRIDRHEPHASAATRRVRAALLCAAAALLACGGESAAPGPRATACAALVGFYRGFEAPVEIVAFEASHERPQVRIEYRGVLDGGTATRGSALCRFTAQESTAPEIQAAFVDENRLAPEEIAAFARSRRAGPPGS